MSRPKIAVVLVAATLLFGACSSKDAKASDVQKVLEEAGATTKQAKCAATKIHAALSQKELNDLAGADHAKDIDPATSKKIAPILTDCLSSTGATESTTTSTTTG